MTLKKLDIKNALLSFVVALVLTVMSYLSWKQIEFIYITNTTPEFRVTEYCLNFKRTEDVCHCYRIHGLDCVGIKGESYGSTETE